MWTPELMGRMMELAERKAQDFSIGREHDLKRFREYLESIGAELRNDILPEEDHLGKTMAQIMDGEEPEPDDQWQKRCRTHLENIANNTGKFPVPISFASKKGYLLPNDLAQQILALGSFPPIK